MSLYYGILKQFDASSRIKHAVGALEPVNFIHYYNCFQLSWLIKWMLRWTNSRMRLSQGFEHYQHLTDNFKVPTDNTLHYIWITDCRCKFIAALATILARCLTRNLQGHLNRRYKTHRKCESHRRYKTHRKYKTKVH